MIGFKTQSMNSIRGSSGDVQKIEERCEASESGIFFVILVSIPLPVPRYLRYWYWYGTATGQVPVAGAGTR